MKRALRAAHVLFVWAALASALILGSVSMAVAQSPGPQAQWVSTGRLNVPRAGHTATLLHDGRVLVVGGADDSPPELYDPISGTWSPTGSTRGAHYRGHTATLLQDGRVLVAGGRYQPTVELYDPATGSWTTTGELGKPRWDHTATLLQDGKVMIAGGRPGYWYALSDSEIYDPANGLWALGDALSQARYGHTATLLPNGQVIALGGWQNDLEKPLYFSSGERYDLATRSWKNGGMLRTGKRYHSATLLPDGKILILGGFDVASYVSTQGAELFDPSTGSSSRTGNLVVARFEPTATLLPGKGVLITGGILSPSDNTVAPAEIPTAEMFDLKGESSQSAGALVAARHSHTATLLQDGRVLVAGGRAFTQDGNETPLASAELYGNFPPGTIAPALTGSWFDPAQSGHGLFVEVLPNNQFLAAWFTFNPAGTEQAWIVGVGTYAGNTATITAVAQPTGGRWIPNFDATRVVNNAWGTLKFTFTDCNHGKVEFVSTSGYGAGSMNLTRLTQPAGLNCL